VIYVEPVAVMLARNSGHPVKVVMSREDVFRATGPTSGASMTVKIGVKRDGTIVAADGLFKLQAGAFPGSPFMSTCMCAFAPYDIQRAIGYDVVCNRPKVAAYRAPGSPMAPKVSPKSTFARRWRPTARSPAACRRARVRQGQAFGGAKEAPSLTAAARDGDGNMRSGRKNARGAGPTKEWNDRGLQKIDRGGRAAFQLAGTHQA
jgi:CO/xanthine dehydrogenase Mo-binding subunit